MESTPENEKTNIEELLQGIDKQLLMRLLDSLVAEQIPDVDLTPKAGP